MYKDKDKQREAQREWVRQKRATKGSTKQGSTVMPTLETPTVTEFTKTKFNAGEISPPSEPRSPVDRSAIDGSMPIETLAMMDAGCGDKLTHGLKRGKDIKCFADLPPDVQQTIDRLSTVDGKIDQTIKANRTAIAINYQHIFPNSYYSRGFSSVIPSSMHVRREGQLQQC